SRNVNISCRYASPWRNRRPASAVREYENAVAHTASAAAQISILTIASPVCPRRSDPIMNGNAGSVLRIGTSAGTPIANATKYDSAVPPTITRGARAGCIFGGLYSAHEGPSPRRRGFGAPPRAGVHVEHGPA